MTLQESQTTGIFVKIDDPNKLFGLINMHIKRGLESALNWETPENIFYFKRSSKIVVLAEKPPLNQKICLAGHVFFLSAFAWENQNEGFKVMRFVAGTKERKAMPAWKDF